MVGELALKYDPSPDVQLRGSLAANSDASFVTAPVVLLSENKVGPLPPRLRSRPRKMYIVFEPAWLLMFNQYEYPTGLTQSSPPQSAGTVNRYPRVPYGAGNENAPRVAGTNAAIWDTVSNGRTAVEVASSTNPPGALPCALSVTTTVWTPIAATQIKDAERPTEGRYFMK